MNKKSIFRDIVLLFVTLSFNILLIFLTLKLINNINGFLLSIVYEKSIADDLFMKIHLLSLNGIFFILFCFFIYLDMKIFYLKRGDKSWSTRVEKNSILGNKEFINKSYNVYKRVPIEYPINQIIKIYLLRFLIIFLIMLPLYLVIGFMYFFINAPFVTSVLTIFVFLFVALSYLFGTKIGKEIEIRSKNFINRFKPDELKRK